MNEPYSPAIITIIQMMETLPLNLQNQIIQHLQNYLLDLQDDIRWETSFAKTETNLSPPPAKPNRISLPDKPPLSTMSNYRNPLFCRSFGKNIESLIQTFVKLPGKPTFSGQTTLFTLPYILNASTPQKAFGR